MKYDEFKRQLGKAGVTAHEFGCLLKLHPKSISNYSRHGEVPSHLAVIAALMGEMAERSIDFRTVLSGIEITQKKPRGAGKPGKFGGTRQHKPDLLKD